jgi:hypothetical protein
LLLLEHFEGSLPISDPIKTLLINLKHCLRDKVGQFQVNRVISSLEIKQSYRSRVLLFDALGEEKPPSNGNFVILLDDVGVKVD